MTALTLAVALLSVSTAPASINHNPGINASAPALAFNAPATTVALIDPTDELPKCFPYCK